MQHPDPSPDPYTLLHRAGEIHEAIGLILEANQAIIVELMATMGLDAGCEADEFAPLPADFPGVPDALPEGWKL